MVRDYKNQEEMNELENKRMIQSSFFEKINKINNL
jgi:hypothetical protein